MRHIETVRRASRPIPSVDGAGLLRHESPTQSCRGARDKLRHQQVKVFAAGSAGCSPVVVPGMVLVISERDYCYGHGDLILRVTGIVVDVGLLATLHWVPLTGDALHHDSGAVCKPDLEVLVRVSSLAAVKRSNGYLPASASVPGVPYAARAGPPMTICDPWV